MNNQKETKQYYITIDGQEIPVSEEVYRAYKRPAWAEHKREERGKRCIIAGVRCKKDCSQCPHRQTGSALSLDDFSEDGFTPADLSADVEEIVASRILLEDLFNALEELDPEGRLLCQLVSEGQTERSIAEHFGISQVAVGKRKKKLFAHLREILGDWK